MSGTGENASDAPGGELPEYADRVLDVAERIPPGRVMTYGDVAEYLNEEEGHPEAHPEASGGERRIGPRQVGRAMALYGGAVPWWRVVRADGTLLPGSERRALQHYRTEGTPLREPRRTAGSREERTLPRLDMARARWDGGEPDAGDAPDVSRRRHEG
ncbi:MGMT family protein [Streptomyces niger]|uniref:MGMT family protein n=1 Tax=Streptomyces niger TaxID=66373 RepID=UPI00069C06B3|nr:MGMT family protein [Streptomyces niger]